jgi:hypothetical protein
VWVPLYCFCVGWPAIAVRGGYILLVAHSFPCGVVLKFIVIYKQRRVMIDEAILPFSRYLCLTDDVIYAVQNVHDGGLNNILRSLQGWLESEE